MKNKNYHYDPDWERNREYEKALRSIKRRRSRPKTMKELLLLLLGCILYPFYKLVLGIIWLWDYLFYDHIETGNNGILGPGYRSYSTTRFSWGKLSFFIVILFIIFYFIFG